MNGGAVARLPRRCFARSHDGHLAMGNAPVRGVLPHGIQAHPCAGGSPAAHVLNKPVGNPAQKHLPVPTAVVFGAPPLNNLILHAVCVRHGPAAVKTGVKNPPGAG